MGELQVHTLHDLSPGEFWAMEKTSGRDAQVKRMGLGEANESNWSSLRILTFNNIGSHADARSNKFQSRMGAALEGIQVQDTVVAVASIESPPGDQSCCCRASRASRANGNDQGQA